MDAAVHAIGDRANALVLDTFALATPASGDGRAPAGGSSTLSCCAMSTRPGSPRSGRRERAAGTRARRPRRRRPALGRAHRPRVPDADVARGGRRGRPRLRRTGGAADPWVAIAAAVHRSADGRVWHPEQEIPRRSRWTRTGPDGPVRWGGGPTCRHRPGSGGGARRALRAMPVAGTLLADAGPTARGSDEVQGDAARRPGRAPPVTGARPRRCREVGLRGAVPSAARRRGVVAALLLVRVRACRGSPRAAGRAASRAR